MTRPAGPPPRGVLRLTRSVGPARHARQQPAPALLAYIDCYWMVRWDLRGQAPRLAETLPHPCVYWVTELGASAIQGVSSARFCRMLEGRGRVFGVRFRPGGFFPFYQKPISGLTDRSLSLTEAFGREGAAFGQDLIALDHAALAAEPADGCSPDDEADQRMMTLTDRFLLDRLPPGDRRLERVTTIVHAIATTPGLTRVETVAEQFGTTVRSLQRLFSQWVGVSPKWVIKRYRLHEALERVDAGGRVAWPRLAAELGYFDQTHFIREFKALIGQSPAEYRKG